MLIYTVNVQPNSFRHQAESAMPEPDWQDDYLAEIERKSNQHTLTGNNQPKPTGTQEPLPVEDWSDIPAESLASSLTSQKGEPVEQPMTEVSWEDV